MGYIRIHTLLARRSFQAPSVNANLDQNLYYTFFPVAKYLLEIRRNHMAQTGDGMCIRTTLLGWVAQLQVITSPCWVFL